MKKKKEKKLSDPKQVLNSFLMKTGQDFYKSVREREEEMFIVDQEGLNTYEQATIDIAEHKEDAQNLFSTIVSLMPVKQMTEQFMEQTGIDIEKEKAINDQRYTEVVKLFKEGVSTLKSLSEKSDSIDKLLDSMEVFKELLNELKEFKKTYNKAQPIKEDYILKSDVDDIFDIDVPENFWEDILYEEED